MRPAPIGTVYTSLEAFYCHDDRRRWSREWDYGCHWKVDDGRDFPRWRVSWVVDTGEVIAVELGSRLEKVLVLGCVEHEGASQWDEGIGGRIEHVMDGWADDGPRTLDWARQRIAERAPKEVVVA